MSAQPEPGNPVSEAWRWQISDIRATAVLATRLGICISLFAKTKDSWTAGYYYLPLRQLWALALLATAQKLLDALPNGTYLWSFKAKAVGYLMRRPAMWPQRPESTR